MEVIGKIIQVLPIQEGVSKAGKAWRKRYYVLETEETYPRKIAFYVFGDERVNQYDQTIKGGMKVRLSFDIESREWQGKWFTDISGWKIEPIEDTASQAPVSQAKPAPSNGFIPPMPPTVDTAGPTDDLPF